MWITTFILAIIIALLQSSIVPAATIFGSIIDLILIATLIFLFFGAFRQASLFLLISSIMLAILSGIPIIYLILPNFLLMVAYLILSSRRIISLPSTLFSLPLFFIAPFVANFAKLLIMQRFSFSLIAPISTGAIFTAAVGGLLYFLCSRAYHMINPQILRDRIKISRL